MASGFEIFSVIHGSIEVTKLTRDLYDAIKTFEGLPKAFEEVNKQLPLVQDALERVERRTSCPDDATRDPVKEILQQCDWNIKRLRDVFQALKDAEGKSITKAYTRAVIHIGKRSRVEDLMKDTLSNIKKLAANQQFQLVDRIQELQNAIDSLTKIPPSIPDAELETMFASPTSQQIGDNNMQITNKGNAYDTCGIVNTGHFQQTNNNHTHPSKDSPWNAVASWLKLFGQQSVMHASEMHRTTHQMKTQEGTCQWLLDKPLFRDWATPGSSKKVFWLYGESGHGKSVLCCRAIRHVELGLRHRFGSHVQAAFHFYDYNDGTESPMAVLCNLADSLFRQKYNQGDQVSDIIHGFSSTKPGYSILQDFIGAIVTELGTAYIFLDGLDEVFHDEERRQNAIQTLKFCLSLTTKKNADVKVWCSSQDCLSIRQAMDKYQHYIYQPLANEHESDIRMVINEAVRRILGDHGHEKKQKYLLEIGNTVKGHFLWATFAIHSIEQACTDGDLDECVQNLPPDFKDYLRKKISYIKPDSYKILSQVLSCLVYAKRPLSFDELCDAVGDQLHIGPIKDQCSPFIRIERVSKCPVAKWMCSVCHTSVRRFFQQHPDILQSEDQRRRNASEEFSISPRTLAHATLRYLRQPQYQHLGRLQMKGALTTFTTGDSSDDRSHIIHQQFLIYCVKNWTTHVDELYQWYRNVRPESVDALWKDVHEFVLSKNFHTCLQIQSLIALVKFPGWYLNDDKGNEKEHFINMPRFYAARPEGESLNKQYKDAMSEWGYFLGSESVIHGNFPGEIIKLPWRMLGRSNFMHRIESRLSSYGLESNNEENVSLDASSISAYFLGCGSDARTLQVVSLRELQVWNDMASRMQSQHKQKKGNRSKVKMKIEIQQWTMEKSAHQHELLEKTQWFELTDDQLDLYTKPLKLKAHEVGRPGLAAITEDGELLRIGPEIYVRNSAGDFELLDYGCSQIEYVEEACRRGPWVAVVHRRGIRTAEPEGNHVEAPRTDHCHEEQSGCIIAEMQPEADSTLDERARGWKSKRSDDEPDPDRAEKWPSDSQLLAIFFQGPSKSKDHHCLYFAYRRWNKLFNSPPVIHPTRALAIWPLRKNEILFVDLTNSPEKHYFIAPLSDSALDLCPISIQAKFSDCGQFLHLASLDARWDDDDDDNSTQPNEGETKTPCRLSQLYLRVSTCRLSDVILARGRPKLEYETTVRLDCELLRKDSNYRLTPSPLPYTITWTASHAYATESHRVLRVYRLPLYREVEEHDHDQDAQLRDSVDKRRSPGSGYNTSLNSPKSTQVAFTNEASIFLPHSASRRSVSFFPAPDKATRAVKVDKKGIGKANSPSSPLKRKREGSEMVATVIISPEDSFTSKVQQSYHAPPQVMHLTADEFGSWKRVSEDDCSARTGGMTPSRVVADSRATGTPPSEGEALYGLLKKHEMFFDGDDMGDKDKGEDGD